MTDLEKPLAITGKKFIKDGQISNIITGYDIFYFSNEVFYRPTAVILSQRVIAESAAVGATAT
jgi:hypothetical protein